jgi:ABC-type transport system substrate-binding protein
MKWHYWLLGAMFFLAGCKGCNEKNDAQAKKVFRYNQWTGLTSLDPAFSKDQYSMWACNHVFNSLVQLDDNLETQPSIAKSWQVSEDGLTYTFKLRNDVYFQDDACFESGKGRVATAQDVAYSFSRIIDPKTASPGAWIFNNVVDTVQPFTAIDDTTFQLKLMKPFRPMLGILSMQYCSVVPQEAVNKYGKEFRKHPVGTGPFKFKLWNEGEVLILVKNDNYFEKDEQGNRLPYIDGINVSFITNKKTEFLAFKQKQLDFVSGLDASYIDEVLNDDGKMKPELADKFNLQKSPYLNTEYLGFLLDNDANNPLSDVRIRKAINYGFDRQEMIKYLRNGVGKPAEQGFTPYGLPSFTDSIKGFSYQPDKAKDLLKQAGYPDGKGLPEIKLYTNETYKEYALFISKQLERIGMKIKVEIVQGNILREWMAQGKAKFFRGSWLADYPDAENYFTVFYGNNEAPPNYTRYNNKAFNRVYEKCLNENDDEARYSMYHSLEEMLINDAPVVPLYYDEVLRFTQKNIEGLSTNGQNMLTLKRVRMK